MSAPIITPRHSYRNAGLRDARFRYVPAVESAASFAERMAGYRLLVGEEVRELAAARRRAERRARRDARSAQE